MADVTLSFTAPGIFQAIGQTTQLRREVTRVGVEEKKVQVRRKSAAAEAVRDQGIIRRAVNRTTAAIGRQIAVLRARLPGAGAGGGAGGIGRGGAGQEAGRVLGRAGGRVGSLGNQLGTAFGGSKALAAFSIGAIAAGLALNGLAAASTRQENIASKIVQTNQQVLSAAQGIRQAGQGRALGFGQRSAQPFREIVSRAGAAGAVGAANRLAGEGVNNADKQILAAIKSGAVKRLGITAVEDVIRTGNKLGIAPDFAKFGKIGPRGQARLADSGGLEDFLIDTGPGRTVSRALRDQRDFGETELGGRLNQVQSRQGDINREIFDRFLGGSGAAKLSKDLAGLRDAESAAIVKVIAALEREAEIAETKADAEFDIIRRLREVGSVVGFGTSRSQELGDINAARANLR